MSLLSTAAKKLTEYAVYITATAAQALTDIRNYYIFEQHLPDIGLKMHSELLSTIQSLSTFPERCPIVYQKDNSILVRRVLYKHFSIFYEIHQNRIYVTRILHSAQNLNFLLL